MNEASPDVVQFIGRFHPLLVHLPIGFLLLLAALEGLSLWPSLKHLRQSSRVILVLSLIAAAGAATCGWLLSLGGGYDATLLTWHQWTGTGVVPAVLLLLILHRRGRLGWYRASLCATVALLGLASHYGGSLTHGRDYLTRHAPAPLRFLLAGKRPDQPTLQTPQPDPLRGPVFAAAIRPVLNDYCVACHGPEKAKGGLRLDTYEALTRGGDGGPSIIPGNASNSLLLQRMSLPLDHEDRMPPEGKPQPSADQIALLRWWVEHGAPADKPANDLNPPPPILQHLRTARP